MALAFDEWIKHEDYGDAEQLRRAYAEGVGYAKQIEENAYIEAEGDAALRLINHHKWELEAAIKSREQKIERWKATAQLLAETLNAVLGFAKNS